MNKCLSHITHKDGTITKCNMDVKGCQYPLCKRHFRRRFRREQLKEMCANKSNLICHEILKSGKNKGLCCSLYTENFNKCYMHLKSYLGDCYYPDCENIAFYKNVFCSKHGCANRKNPCPCPMHKLDNDIYNTIHYCYKHGSNYCECLYDYSNLVSNIKQCNIHIPNDIIDLIFEYGDIYQYSVIKCINKYFNQKNHKTNIAKFYFSIDTFNNISRNNIHFTSNLKQTYKNILLLLSENYIKQNQTIDDVFINEENLSIRINVVEYDYTITRIYRIYNNRFYIKEDNILKFQHFVGVLCMIYLINLDNQRDKLNENDNVLNLIREMNLIEEYNFNTKYEYIKFNDLVNYLIGRYS